MRLYFCLTPFCVAPPTPARFRRHVAGEDDVDGSVAADVTCPFIRPLPRPTTRYFSESGMSSSDSDAWLTPRAPSRFFDANDLGALSLRCDGASLGLTGDDVIDWLVGCSLPLFWRPPTSIESCGFDAKLTPILWPGLALCCAIAYGRFLAASFSMSASCCIEPRLVSGEQMEPTHQASEPCGHNFPWARGACPREAI